MTRPPRDLDPDAELASALLDGEASDAEQERATEPAVAAARRRLARVAEQVGAVPPPPAGTAEAHVEAALAAFGEAPGGAAVVGLDGRRAWWQRVPLVAAAAVVLVVMGAVGLAVRDGDGDDVAATQALDVAEGGAEAFEPVGGTANASGSAEREGFADFEDLAAALGGRLRHDDGEQPRGNGSDPAAEGAPEASPLSEPAVPGGCDPVGAAGVDPADARQVLAVVVAGRPVTAVVHDHDHDVVVTSVDDRACAVVDRRPLPR